MSSQKTIILFVRHAQSVYGEDDRARPLTEAGLRDRAIVLETLKERKIDAFLCSPYERSLATIRPAADYFRMDIRTDERFRERKAGSHESGLLARRWADFSFAEEGGESLGSVQERNMAAMRDVLAEYAGRTVVIGTHGTAMSTILHYYNPDFGLAGFLRIVDRMPCMIEMAFESGSSPVIRELAWVDKSE